MDFLETDEQQMLREAVATISKKYGHSYFVEKAHSGQKATEMWKDLGDNGFCGVNIPAEYGGGGMGIAELGIVAEETAAAGAPMLMLVVSPAICGT
ncbi:MAG: acyl-CoA dehydrogenase family protein, partial [Acidimicrobiales bacterium]|nr:acyl-CoA dehydrogenase family protein [Acidimicrobiales bacterium]